MTKKEILKFFRRNLILLLFLELVIVGVILLFSSELLEKFFLVFSNNSGYSIVIQRAIVGGISALTLFILVILIEKRYLRNIPFQKPQLLLTGTIIGLVLFSLTNLIIYLLGSYQITGFNQGQGWVFLFFLSISAGFSEEIVFRGIIYRHIENRFGTTIALIVSALFFGFAHIVNPNSSLFAAIAISLEAGVMLGIAYTYSKSIWLPIGIHFAWNFTQGGVFSARVSGLDFTEGIFAGKYSGHNLITGGSFGPEASIPALIVCTSFGIGLIYLTLKKGRYIYNKKKVISN